MSTHLTQPRRAAIVAALVAAIAALPVTVPAHAAATPPGCTQTWSTPYVGSGGLIKGYGSGSCSVATVFRTFRLQLIHDFSSPWPDVVVVTAADGGRKKVYSTSYSVCDNGGTTTYYNHAYFGGYAGGNSPTAAFAHC